MMRIATKTTMKTIAPISSVSISGENWRGTGRATGTRFFHAAARRAITCGWLNHSAALATGAFQLALWAIGWRRPRLQKRGTHQSARRDVFIATEGFLKPKKVLHHLCVVEGTPQRRRRVDRQDRWYMSQSGGGCPLLWLRSSGSPDGGMPHW